MDIWKHGTYLDLWSIVHFLSGFLLLTFLYLLGYSFMVASLVSVCVLVLWEVFEWIINIIEPSLNAGTDIVVGIIGIIMAGWLFYVRGESPYVYFYTALVVAGGLACWGFFDFLKRGYR